MTYYINLTSLSDVADFVKLNSSMPFNIDVSSGHYNVDGKSILGVLSIDTSHKVKCTLHSNDSDLISIYDAKLKEIAEVEVDG